MSSYRKVLASYLMPRRVVASYLEAAELSAEMRTGQVLLSFLEASLKLDLPSKIGSTINSLAKELRQDISFAQPVAPAKPAAPVQTPQTEDEELPYERAAAVDNPYDAKIPGLVSSFVKQFSKSITLEGLDVPTFIAKIKGYDLSTPKMLKQLGKIKLGGGVVDPNIWSKPEKLQKVLEALPPSSRTQVFQQAQRIFAKFRSQTGEQFDEKWMKRFGFKSEEEVVGFLVVKSFTDFFANNSARLVLPEGISVKELATLTKVPTVGHLTEEMHNSYKGALDKMSSLIPKPKPEPKDKKKPDEQPGEKSEEQKKQEWSEVKKEYDDADWEAVKKEYIPVTQPLLDGVRKLQETALKIKDLKKKEKKLPGGKQKVLIDKADSLDKELNDAIGLMKSAGILPEFITKVVDKILKVAPVVQEKILEQLPWDKNIWRDKNKIQKAVSLLSRTELLDMKKRTERVMGDIAAVGLSATKKKARR